MWIPQLFLLTSSLLAYTAYKYTQSGLILPNPTFLGLSIHDPNCSARRTKPKIQARNSPWRSRCSEGGKNNEKGGLAFAKSADQRPFAAGEMEQLKAMTTTSYPGLGRCTWMRRAAQRCPRTRRRRRDWHGPAWEFLFRGKQVTREFVPTDCQLSNCSVNYLNEAHSQF